MLNKTTAKIAIASETYKIAITNPLFSSLDKTAYQSVCVELGATLKSYAKNAIVVLQGEPISKVGLVLEGELHITKEDEIGNVALLTAISPGEIFAEVFACADIKYSPVTITALRQTKVLYFDWKRLESPFSPLSTYTARLCSNMLKIIATKTLHLNSRVEILSKKTIAERLLCYLRHEAKGRTSFTIPHNRNELATVIAADRSALSSVLAKLAKQGVLSYKRNHFTLS